MATLKETKDRIASVRTTLKTTSAMKLVASSRLRKGQTLIENMHPYQERLGDILHTAIACMPASPGIDALCRSRAEGESPRVAIVAISSNSSLCGAFNSNVIREVTNRLDALKEESAEVTVYSVGRKMADAMRRAGHVSPQDFNLLVSHPSYEASADLAQHLIDAFVDGRFDRVEFIYNHFVSTACQKVVTETYLPMARLTCGAEDELPEEYIIEPSADELIENLLPRVLRLKVYTCILDSYAAEHAARTIAMQTATDNGEALLQQLTLEYNKGRQQKITSEILDLVGGSLA